MEPAGHDQKGASPPIGPFSIPQDGSIQPPYGTGMVSKLDRKWIFKRSIKPSAMRAAILIQNPQAFEHSIEYEEMASKESEK
jgi:hypothetical protein